MEHQVRFLPMERRVRVPTGTTLLEAAQRAGLPVARACGGAGLCGGCALEVLEGSEELPLPGGRERNAKRANRIDPTLRISCLVKVRGDVVVTAGYW